MFYKTALKEWPGNKLLNPVLKSRPGYTGS